MQMTRHCICPKHLLTICISNELNNVINDGYMRTISVYCACVFTYQAGEICIMNKLFNLFLCHQSDNNNPTFSVFSNFHEKSDLLELLERPCATQSDSLLLKARTQKNAFQHHSHT